MKYMIKKSHIKLLLFFLNFHFLATFFLSCSQVTPEVISPEYSVIFEYEDEEPEYVNRRGVSSCERYIEKYIANVTPYESERKELRENIAYLSSTSFAAHDTFILFTINVSIVSSKESAETIKNSFLSLLFVI